MAQGAAEGGGKGRLSPDLLWECCSFPLPGTCCFHRNQLLLEDGEVKFCSWVILLCAFSPALCFGLCLWDIFVHYCLLFLDNQCSKEQMLSGYWKVQNGKWHLGTFSSLRVKSVKAEWSLCSRTWAQRGRWVGPEGQDSQFQICTCGFCFLNTDVYLWIYDLLPCWLFTVPWFLLSTL